MANFYYWLEKNDRMKILIVLLLVPFLISPAFAQLNSQVLPTEKGTLNVDFSTTPAEISPGDIVKFNIDFINPNTEKIQEHIDYRLTVFKDGTTMFGPIPLTHTSTGSVSIPVELGTEGNYDAVIEVEGILFQPIPLETVSFNIVVGDAAAQPPTPTPNGEGGGCLIATATYGTELAPEVQQLREIRDNVVLKTKSGLAFMTAFNQLYYSFSPSIADFERENSIFRETIKVALTPLLTTLSIFNYAEIDSEVDMLTYGISVISLNVGIYIGIPAFAILKLYQFRRN